MISLSFQFNRRGRALSEVKARPDLLPVFSTAFFDSKPGPLQAQCQKA
jgi:hypothetical protein